MFLAIYSSNIIFAIPWGLARVKMTMNNALSLFPSKKTRIGFHYFSDTIHYRECDLQTWLPRLKPLGASWLVVRSSLERQIPAEFIRALVQEDIEPVIQFSLSMGSSTSLEKLERILVDYSRSGARAVVFFERPNSQFSWPSPDWAQQGLVERFLEQFLPLANLALYHGLIPLLPPLEPGGCYRDTTFFRALIESLIRRHEMDLIQNLAIGSYAWTFGRSLNWGAGGPQRWPKSHSHALNPSVQDQRGFRTYDWYQSIVHALLGKSVPVILFEMGICQDPLITLDTHSYNPQDSTFITAGRLLEREVMRDPQNPTAHLEPLPDEIVAGNFWLLSADSFSPYLMQAWFRQDGSHSAQVDEWIRWMQITRSCPDEKRNDPFWTANSDYRHSQVCINFLPPVYEWDASEYHLDFTHPSMNKYPASSGFPKDEPAFSSRMAVIEDEQTYTESLVDRLRINGAVVDRIGKSGTSIATQYSER